MVTRAFRKISSTNFVSFSGIDGAGKSTQIEALRTRLEEDGLRVILIRFWDDIARLTGLREATGHRIFKGDKGIGDPAAPINRRDKNVRSWFMTLVRLFLYFLDAISVRLAVKKALNSEADLVIFDRYVYDELANLTLHNPAIRAYVRLIMKLVPQPDISYLLDADPEKARARKPEYPLEFLRTNRQSYLALNDLIGGMTIISPKPVKEVAMAVLKHAQERLSLRDPQRKKNSFKASRDSGNDPVHLESPQSRPAMF
jgi:thymidylate kinase